MNVGTYLMALLLVASTRVAEAVQEGASLQSKPLSQLEQRLSEIDDTLRTLARYSLRSGVGPIGYRSQAHADAAHTEWVEIALGKEETFDEIVLVPAICHDAARGFSADGFPVEFKIRTGKAQDTNGTVLASFGSETQFLPRIAPILIPCPGTTASWVRLEATLLSPRAFDGQYNLELAELMIFAGEENLALRKPVRTSSSGEGPYSKARHPAYLTDGFLPYLMQASQGRPSVAYISPPISEKNPWLLMDLEASHPVNRIHLHAVDVDDVFPQSVPYDFCLPRHLVVEGANRADFSDRVRLTALQSHSPYDRGPLMILPFSENSCRFVRLTALQSAEDSEVSNTLSTIGFAEIEIFSKGLNVALDKSFTTSFEQPNLSRTLSSLTDGANYYGKILSIKAWVEELSLRHDLQQERARVENEMKLRYARQKILLQRVSWLAALLIAGLIFTILIDRMVRLREVARIKERLAADLHDEIGANLHTIGMLSDLAEDAKEAPDELSMLHGRIRSMTERSGTAVRHFADLLNANGLYTDLISDIRRTSERIMAKFDKNIVIEGEEHIKTFSSRTCFDLLLFYKECLVNISRHSGATRFSMRLVVTKKELCLTVSDNGKGVSDRIPDSLKRRARLMGATLVSETPAAGGTSIRLTLRVRRWGWRK
jgi:signal transduction histidine kinase